MKRRLLVTLGTLAALAAPLGAAPARAATLSVGLLSGATIADPHLADFQWDVRPKLGLGGDAAVGLGRFAVGARVWRSETTQQLDPAIASASPVVRRTRVEAVARLTVLHRFGTALSLAGSAGLLHLGYAPDHVTVDAGGTPLDVQLPAIDTGSGSLGAAFELPLAHEWAASAEVTREWFGLDTAHRSGAEIVKAHDAFGDWSIRFGLAREFGRR